MRQCTFPRNGNSIIKWPWVIYSRFPLKKSKQLPASLQLNPYVFGFEFKETLETNYWISMASLIIKIPNFNCFPWYLMPLDMIECRYSSIPRKFRKSGCFQKGLERRLLFRSDRFSENRSRNTIKKGLFKHKKQKNRKPIWKFIHFFSALGMYLRTSRAD